MKRCSKPLAVLAAVIVLAIAAAKMVPGVGVRTATPAEEQAVLQSLRHATAKQTLCALFWAVNHHSRRVKATCLSSNFPRRSLWFDDARRWDIISMKQIRSQKLNARERVEFSVKFRHYQRYGTHCAWGWKSGETTPWTFTLYRDSATSPWRVCDYGMC